MADFRKWFLVVAVVLLAAATASAQNYTMTCSMTGNTELLRSGGVTEPVGEITLACDSTKLQPLGATVTAQFTEQVNAPITNAISGGLVMAAAVVAYDVAPFGYYSTTQGRPAGSGILQFPNVVLPTGTTFSIRFVNVRVAALSGLVINPPTSPAGLPEVIAGVSANSYSAGGWSVTFNQSVASVVVGQIVSPFVFAVTNCTGGAAAPVALQQCVAYGLNSRDILGSATSPTFGVTFTENAPLAVGAFKNVVEEDGVTLAPPVAAAVTGPQICDTAHNKPGDVAVIVDGPSVAVPACTAPVAYVSNGTRLVAQFTLDPRLVGKAHVWVSQFNTAGTALAAGKLATITSATGTGKDPYSVGPSVGCGPEGNYWVELPDTTATKTAAWEVTSDDVANIDSLTFAVAITYAEGALPSLPTGSAYQPIAITGTMGPIDVPTPTESPISIPVPRFFIPPVPGTVNVSIQHCVTNLLFPYVTDVVGFETGIAIANTSLDTAWNLTDPPSAPVAANGVIANWGTASDPQPYNTTPQSGPCNLYLFGSASAISTTTAASPVQAIASATTNNIVAGQIFADTLSTIFNLNTAASKMSGYVIARCEFQFGHGYAYLVSPSNTPQGYLALIIPDRNVLNGDTLSSTGFTSTPIRIAQPFSNALFDEQGEVLAE